MKKLLIAGTHSGVGKTTLSLGIMAALKKRGMKVQPFKVGPDYIDPAYHTYVTGQISRNLDQFMVSNEQLKYLFQKAGSGKDISIVEGVMGLYDGKGASKDVCSTGALAKQLDLPVVLVIDARAMAASSAAMVLGYQQLDPQVRLVGVIANNVRTASHFELVKEAVATYCQLPVLGYLPPDDNLKLGARHLGLIPSCELTALEEKIDLLGEQVERYIDLDALLALSEGEETVSHYEPLDYFSPTFKARVKGKRLALAQDQAFHFYYQDNLELLSDLGIEIIPFSPLAHEKLPDCDYIYIGGGFPELYAEALEANVAMRRELLAASQRGLPIYAECGGLMYLGSHLEKDGKSYEMVGVFQGKSEMTGALQRFGYCTATPLQKVLIAEEGQQLRGHEFHYSQFVTSEPAVFCMEKQGIRGGVWQGGWQKNKTLAAYLHLHFYSQLEMVSCFLEKG